MKSRIHARSLTLAAGMCVAVAGRAGAQSFTNGNFETGTLTGWTVVNTSNGVGAPGNVVSIDIDGPGALGTTQAAHYLVGQATAQTGVQQGIEMTQNLTLNAGVQYTFDFDWSAQNSSATNNAEGGVFSLIVNGTALATAAAGGTSSTTPHYGHITTTYTPGVTASYSCGIRITRPFTVGGTVSEYVDNVVLTVPYNPTDPGACCANDGTCADGTFGSCTSSGGVFQGLNSLCSGVTCPPPVACCKADGTCSNLPPTVCAGQGGVAQGAGTNCGTFNCNGACCKADGTCASMSQSACTALGAGNVFQGFGSLCGSVTCPAAAACCKPDATCISVVQAACTAQGGLYQGAGSACATTVCPHSITTTFVSNNGGSAGGAVYFDISVQGTDLVFSSMDTNCSATVSSSFGVTIYTFPGTWVGHSTSAAGWTQVATGTGVSAGTDQRSHVTFATPFVLNASTTSGVAIVMTAPGAHRYTNVTGVTNVSDSFLTLSLGGASNAPFGTLIANREWDGTLYYDSANPADPGACCKPDGTCADGTRGSCTAAGGVFQGLSSLCSGVTCPPAGACCAADGTCSNITQAACTSHAGTWHSGSTCATFTCPQPGACCSFNGVCTTTLQSACVGTWNAASCATFTCPPIPPTFYQNCNLPTGTTSLNGIAAPAGSQWSEVARDEAGTTYANTNAGQSALAAFREADDFTIPSGGMNVAYIKFAAYQTTSAVVSITSANLQIWNGAPNAGGAVIFGDTTTNRLANAQFAPIFRIFNSVVPGACGGVLTPPDQNRHIQWVYVAVNQFLPAGTYWWDVQMAGNAALTGPWIPTATDPDAIGRQCTGNNANSMVLNAGVWTANTDTGQPLAGGTCLTPPVFTQDLYFELLGTPPACYANCDASTQPPVLNVADFTCFLQKYAAGDPYANCDNSTQPPVLNVADFTCFLQKYAAGCT